MRPLSVAMIVGVGAAVHVVTAASRAMVMLWDGQQHGFRASTLHGFGDDAERWLGYTVPHADATDEVAAMQRAPQQLLGQLAALGDQAGTALTATRALAEARHRATHDALTGLANRVLFAERGTYRLADDETVGAPG